MAALNNLPIKEYLPMIATRSSKPSTTEPLKVRIAWILDNTLRNRFTIAEMSAALDETYPRAFEFRQGTGAVKATLDRMDLPEGWAYLDDSPRRLVRTEMVGTVEHKIYYRTGNEDIIEVFTSRTAMLKRAAELLAPGGPSITLKMWRI